MHAERFFICEGGEPATSPAGWCPTDFTPHQDMDQWLDEGAGDAPPTGAPRAAYCVISGACPGMRSP